MGLFYYTLGNLEPRIRSQLAAIHLVAVVRTDYINTYGVDEVFHPFVEDIKKLESVSCINREWVVSTIKRENLFDMILRKLYRLFTSVQDSSVTFVVEGERKQLRGT